MKYTKKVEEIKPTKSIEKRIQKNESSIMKAKGKKSFNAPKDTNSLLSKAELNSEGKPIWSKLKEKGRELKKTRKSKKNENYDVISKVKHLWEIVRVKKMEKEKRTKLIDEILDLLKGNLNKLVFSHDGARIVQTLIKFGTLEQRTAIFDGIQSSIILMAQSSYASRILVKLFKYASKDLKPKIIKSFYGNIVKLLSNSFGYKLVEIAYISGNREEKNAMCQEFYGDLYKVQKDSSISCLQDIIDSISYMKPAILSSTKANICRLLNKERHESTILHAIIEDFLKHCDEGDRDEVLALVRPSIDKYLITKQSVSIGIMSIWHGNKKERKQILKTLKGSYRTFSFSNEGRFLIQALFDTIDDTVTVSKIVFPEILSDLKEFVNNECGRRVLLYIIAHRNPLYFHPDEVKILQQGDDNKISKKPMDQKIAELRDNLNNHLIKAINEDIVFWMQQTSIALITLNVLNTYKGEELGTAFENIAKLILDENSNVANEKDSKPCSYIEHPGINKILKKLIQFEAKRENKDDEDKVLFSNIVIQYLTPAIISWLLTFNRGCFFLINLLDCDISNSFKLTLGKILKNSKEASSGVKLLSKKLTEKK